MCISVAALLISGCDILDLLDKLRDSGIEDAGGKKDGGHDHVHDGGHFHDGGCDCDGGHDYGHDSGMVTDAGHDHGHDSGIVVKDAGHDHGHDAGLPNVPDWIDVTKIPASQPGFSTVRIKPSNDTPHPSDGTGAFRTVCGFSHMSFNDPIVFPGKADAAHLHTFLGNTGTDAFSTANSLLTTGNSTCRGGIANRSAYWVPSLIDATGAPQAPAEAHIYYKTGYGGVPASSVKPFPAGLRVLAGNGKSTSGQQFIGWSCLSGLSSASIPNCAPGDYVVMDIYFPQCWDGKNLDSSDHHSHMAYPDGTGCPATHPVAVSEVSYHIRYLVPSSGTAGWRLSSDMYDRSLPGGFSLHGDWFAAWDEAIVKTFVENCNNPAVDCGSHMLGDGREMY